MNRETTVTLACSDERRLEVLSHELNADGYVCHRASTEAEAQVKAHSSGAEMVILGALEEPLAALKLVRAIRSGSVEHGPINAAVGIIVLGDGGGELELGRYLDAGADDYLQPKAGYGELRARLGAVERRLRPRHGALKRVGALAIDATARTVEYHGQRIAFTPVEFALLDQLASDPTRVYTKQELLRDVWGYRSPGRTRTVDAHACRVRNRLAAAGATQLVANVRGVGYRLCSEPPSTASEPVALRAA